MPDSVITSCSNKTAETAHPSITTTRQNHNHPSRYNQPIPDDGESQSDSSNSNSSLLSSPRYNERHPRVLESVRKKSSGRIFYGSGGCSVSSTGVGSVANPSNRGSFVMLGSRTSLPPLDENKPLDPTESQLALKLRRATGSSSWTNQKILDAIDGLKSCTEELDPCLALGAKSLSVEEEENDIPKQEWARQSSFEKFTVPKSISNLIMKSRSSGSVNPSTSNQNKGSSCYNFLSGIKEDEDEELQLSQESHFSSREKHSTVSATIYPSSTRYPCGKPTDGRPNKLTTNSVLNPTAANAPPDDIKPNHEDTTYGVSK